MMDSMDQDQPKTCNEPDTDSEIIDSESSRPESSLHSPEVNVLCSSAPPVPPITTTGLPMPSSLNIDFGSLNPSALPALNTGDVPSELFFNYQLARSASSFAPFVFPNSPIFIPPSLLKPINYIHNNGVSAAAAAAAAAASAGNHLRPLNLSTSSGGSTAEMVSTSMVTSAAEPLGKSEPVTTTAASKSGSQTGSKRASPSLLCVVCGDLSSGKHYGILACNGCSGFFKRSVRRKLIYRCQAGTGSCIIDKQHRNQCQACRLKKCISMGMNKDAVQNERQPRNTATIRPEVLLTDSNSERLLREGVAATVAAVFGLSNSLRRDGGLCKQSSFESKKDQCSQTRKNEAKGSKEESAPPPPSSSPFLANSANLCYSSPMADYSPMSDMSNPLLLLNPDSFYEISARLLFMAVKWVKNLPSFVTLHFRDQVILLEESWTEIFILSAIQWSLPLDKCSIFSLANIPDGSEHSLDIRVLNDAFERFRTIGTSSAEFSCLKALALFKPEARGLKDVSRIEQMQDQAQLMLLQQVKNQNTANPIRFGKLLLLLLSLKIIPSEKIATIYFKKAIGNTTIEKLLCEMFKC